MTLIKQVTMDEMARYPDATIYNGRKATLVTRGGMGFGLCIQEIKLLTSVRTTYAQHNATRITYIKKRARRASAEYLIDTDCAYVVDGWNHELFDNFSAPRQSDNGVTLRKGLLSACDPQWDELMHDYVASLNSLPILCSQYTPI